MADLICFPQERNVGKARHVAVIYLGKDTERGRNSYWKMVVERLAGTMARCGFSEAEIDREIGAFLWAVEQQIYILTQRNDGPGAA
ncbi:MAG TPA: hypothetical protein DIT93_09135 [Pelagibacterium sp.]|uniref:DUF6074 family protein n=1 Tax=uncultured Pelagibacterium sp. TaxID=1159875 RepID=UPI000C6A0615|nr:hypothetical protein [Pelagibacterium sp.]HCO55167.1 hypothetical protein [Pelagibacterium sp.]|tara:strand:+ start:9089 stop:9346 length:258 start_codon:yes stop_codon:yes gene_type:complete